jgi:acetamidase/formamidase
MFVDVVEFRPEPGQYAYTFGGVAPLREIVPGSVLRLWCDDAFGGAIRSVGNLASACLRPGFLNPQTGPFAVRGAEPGDTLVLHLVDLTPARDWGASTLVPLFGGLTGTDRTALLADPLPERTWIYEVDRARGAVTFAARGGELTLDLPMAPMLGTVGVAPALREVRSSLTPDAFGGNMDTPEMRAGATCYLPVNEPGAIFSVGDGHYRQGEGEACGTAVEGAMDATLIVDLVKGSAGPAPAWPRLENDVEIAVVGSSRPLEDAWRISQVEMITWLGELLGLDRLDAYQLLTQVALAPLANVVDTNYSAVTKVSKTLVPGLRPYDGLHADLRARAASLG